MSKSNPGGNKKRASPSDEAYQARRKLRGLSSVHKAAAIKRHAKRMAKKAAHRAAWEARQPTRARAPAQGA